ncbi:hypothetical protein [Psychrobacter sp. Ps2]|uniref:hypothetical protein n=1 Tax=Psychrobacter sp. Ps2 TaxID=2790956 RepID=UPI001EDE110D|nr:hypothetical protein [Psychrobacter sp. Ps2]MCG3859672.1 hypothetical protein [Psychrobacter sp. Ps2]
MTYALPLCRRVAMLLVLLITFSSSAFATSEKDMSLLAQQDPAPGKAHLYILKRSNLLFQDTPLSLLINLYKLDNITTKEYYKIELWPGSYYIQVDNESEDKTGYYTKSSRKINLAAGDVTVFGINPKHESTYYFKSDVEKTIARRKLKQFIPATEVASAVISYKPLIIWQGPNKDGDAHGIGEIYLADDSVYKGRAINGELTAEGRLQYPNGNFYKGQYFYEKPNGQGFLADKDGRVIAAGEFRDGLPYEGLSIENGKVVSKYRYGQVLETDPKILAAQSVSNEDKKQLANVSQTAKQVSNDIERIVEEKYNAKNEFERREREFPKNCGCAFKVCLTSYSSDSTTEERKAADRLRKAQNKACREWRSSGGSLASRQAALDTKFLEADEKLAKFRKDYEQAKKVDQMAHQQKIEELERSRESRMVNAQKKFEKQLFENAKKQREACQGRENYCGCAAFLQPAQIKKMATCEQ